MKRHVLVFIRVVLVTRLVMMVVLKLLGVVMNVNGKD